MWAGHQGICATFAKLREKYWWPGVYKDIASYVGTCAQCQLYSNVQHRDGLHLTYPLPMHYKWSVYIVVMPMGLWQMKYLLLEKEDLTNQVEGLALRNKTTSTVCKFPLENVICRLRNLDCSTREQRRRTVSIRIYSNR